MKSKIIIIKNNDSILISNNGKRLVIDGEKFDLLKDKKNEEIEKWYLSR